ncbi:MAG: tetratricopeptide repeat protein, partial [Myxococcales bacterium]
MSAGPTKSFDEPVPAGTPALVEPVAFGTRRHCGPQLTDKELTPYFAEGPHAQAKAHFDAERYGQAFELLKDESALPLPARYLRAMALHRLSRSMEAAEAFERLAQEYPALSDRSRFHAGLAFEAAHALEKASKAYAQVPEDSLLHKEARRNLGRVLRQLGDLKGAIDALLPLASRPAPAWGWDYAGDFLFAVAEMEEARGRKDAARAAYLDVWGQHPNSRYAEPALKRATALGGTPSDEHRIARGELLMEAHKNQQAIALLAPLANDPPKGLSDEWLCRARYALGKAYRKERQHLLNIEQQEKVLAACSDPELRAKAWYMGGTSAAIVAPEKAIRFYTGLQKELPDHSFADDALVFASESMVRLQQTDEARQALQTLAKLYPDGDHRADGLFRLFWMERGAGRLTEALGAIERLAEEY